MSTETSLIHCKLILQPSLAGKHSAILILPHKDKLVTEHCTRLHSRVYWDKCRSMFWNSCHQTLVRLVTRQARRDSAMPLLRELHWLPVCHRVTYNIAELTFKALLPTYSSACRFIHLPGLFDQRPATPMLRTDPALSLGTALLCMQPQRFGTRYLSP